MVTNDVFSQTIFGKLKMDIFKNVQKSKTVQKIFKKVKCVSELLTIC